MSLSRKALVIVAVSGLCLVAVLNALSRLVLLRGFHDLEEAQVRVSTRQVKDTLQMEFSALDDLDKDWADWDDTYRFVQDPSLPFAKENLLDESLANAEIHVIVVVNREGRLVYGTALLGNDRRYGPVPDALLRQLGPESPLLEFADTLKNHAGIMIMGETAFLVVSRPIRQSGGEGPSRGTLIMGRLLDEGLVQKLGRTTHVQVAFTMVTAEPPPAADRRSASRGESDVTVAAVDEHTISGRTLLRDINGNPALILRVDLPREIHRQGLLTLRYFMLFLLITSLAFAVVVTVTLHRLILVRVGRLGRSVKGIGASSDPALRVPVEGGDELALMAREINGMLDSLRLADAELLAGKVELEGKIRERTAELELSNRELAREVSVRRAAEEAHQIDEARLEALLKLYQMGGASLKEIAEFTLEEGIRLTGSTIGFISSCDEKEGIMTIYSWSREAMAQCRVEGQPIVYRLADTGLWGEIVRQRKPIIINDYAAANPWKKGIPEGHVPMTRNLGIPVFDGDRIVAVAMVGNKAGPYDESDVRQLTLLMDAMWRIILRNWADEALHRSEQRFRDIANAMADWIWEVDENFIVTYCSDNIQASLGYPPEEVVGRRPSDFMAPEEAERAGQATKKIFAERKPFRDLEVWNLHRDGTRVCYLVSGTPVFDAGGNFRGFRGVNQDITERRRAEESLRESEEKFRILAEQLPGMVFINSGGRVLYANRRSVETLGYTREELTAPGFDFMSFIAEDSREEVGKQFRRHALGEEVEPYECTLVTQDGRLVETIISTKLITFEGQPAILGVVTDITERKQAEQSLRESEEKFRSLTEQLPNMVFINAGGRIIYVNRECEEALGYAREEFFAPDFNFFSLIAPEFRDRIAESWRNHLAGNEVKPFEYALLTKDGRRIEAIITSQLINYGGQTALLGIVTDITERKSAEMALRESEEKFRILAEQMPSIIFINQRGRIRYVNSTCEDVTGYRKEEFYAPDFNFLNVVAPAFQDQVRENFAAYLEGKPLPLYEGDILTRDGRILTGLHSFTTITYQGEPALLAVITDVTQRKLMEKELQAAKEALERQNEELKELDRIKDGLLRDVTHELKTPVAKHFMQLELLKKMIKECGMEEKARNVLRVMESSIRRQENVIRNILDLARLEAGERRYVIRPVLMSELLEDVLEDFHYAFEAHGFAVDREFAGVTVPTDRDILWHVFSNIINNAVKFRTSAGRPELSVTIEQEDGRAMIRFADNGVGLAPEDRLRVFDRFYKGSSSIDGSGVGLTIAKKIVEDLRGSIRIDSRGPGQGTTVTVSLPLEASP